MANLNLIFNSVTICTNASLIALTTWSKNLHGSCAILIAANAFAIAIYSLIPIEQLLICSVAPNGLPMMGTFATLIPPIFFVNCQSVLFPAIALDRLLGATFPIWHKTRIQTNQRRYLAIAFCVVGAYATFMLFLAFQVASGTPQKMISCSTGLSIFGSSTGPTWALNALSILLYSALFVRVKTLKQSTQDKFTKRILKSLIVLCLVELFGWTGNILAKNALIWFAVPNNSSVNKIVTKVFGYSLNLSQALNGIIPFLSSEYRLAVKNTFRRVTGQRSTQIHSNNNNNNTNPTPHHRQMQSLSRTANQSHQSDSNSKQRQLLQKATNTGLPVVGKNSQNDAVVQAWK